MTKNKVSIIGLGYVGLPLAYTIAKNKKYQVYGFDIDIKKIKKILADSNKPANLKISDNETIIKNSEFIIICVPTPVRRDKLPDLKPLENSIKTVKKYLEKDQKIIIESTINPGVCEEILLPILEKTGLRGGQNFELSHCPERINPGDPKWTIETIPRNIGSTSKKGNRKVADFYRSFLKTEVRELSCLKVAEASKVVENTFRDINIAYVNELAKSFDILGIDLVEVINAAANKPFSFMAHYPGCGVGGHCIPVDPYYLIDRAQKSGFEHGFLKKARKINNSMPQYTVNLLVEKLNSIGKPVKNSKIGLLGTAYKGNIDDFRESPSLEIKNLLEKMGADLKIFDPYAKNFNNTKNLTELLIHSEALILATAHSDFIRIPVEKFRQHRIRIIIDGKNCLDKERIIKAGILYKGIGH